MTSAYSKTSENNAAILIDLWQEKYDDEKDGKIILTKNPKHPVYYQKMLDTPQYQLSNRIKNFIDSRSDVKYIILASYDTSEIFSDLSWYKNSRKILGKAYNFKLKKLNLIQGKEKTDNRILNWNTSKIKIAFHFLWEMKYFLSKNDIKAIYYCGESWETCVKERPIGYSNMFHLIKELNKDIEIRVKEDCVLTENNCFFDKDKNPNWMPIGNNEYKLELL